MFSYFDKSGEWPDGRPHLEQASLTVRVFQIVEHQLAKERRKRE